MTAEAPQSLLPQAMAAMPPTSTGSPHLSAMQQPNLSQPAQQPASLASGAPGQMGNQNGPQNNTVAAAAVGSGGAGDTTAAGASPPKSPQDETARAAEDAVLKRGAEIAGVRALLARAFTKPAEEPAQPLTHWDYLLKEAQWLAVDVAQERLWKQTAAMAIAIQVAKLQGSFGLKQPPKDQRRYSDEVKRLQEAAAKEAAAAAGKRATAAVKADNGALKLDPADDPIFAELELLDLTPGTPPLNELYLAYQHDTNFNDAVRDLVFDMDTERLIVEEIAFREHRHEYEAALVSHHLAVQEENRRAMHLDAGLAADGGLELMDGGLGGEEEEAAYMSKKNKRRKAQGYLLDDFKDLDTESIGGAGALTSNKRAASRAQIEDTYFKKRRRERYRDVDVDYDVSQEPTGRYTTRRTAAAMGARASSRLHDVHQKKKSNLGRGDSLSAQQMMRQRVASGVTGMVLWSKSEDELLLAIAYEFSGNWTLVSEVLSLSLSMQGIYRPPALCKQRFRQLMTPENGEFSEELALMNLAQSLTKQQARELLMLSLPVRDDVLMPLMEALVQIGAAAKQKRQTDEKKNEPVRRQRQDPHASHAMVHNAVMQQTGNRIMTPLELGEAVNAAFTQQAKQQQQFLQQAAMQAQQQPSPAAAGQAPAPQQQGPAAPQQQQQAMAAAAAAAASTPRLAGQASGLPGAPGTQMMGAAGAHLGQLSGAGAAPMGGATPGTLPPQQQPMSAGMPASLGAMQMHNGQLMPGMPGSAQTRPLLQPQGLTPQAMAQAAALAQQQQQGTPGATGLPPMSGAAVSTAMGMPSQQQQQQQGTPGQLQGMSAAGGGQTTLQQQQQMNVARQAAAAAAHQAAKNQVTLQQLNHILATNVLPNGTALPPEMRKQIEEKRNSYLAKTQAQQAHLTAQARQQQQVTAAQLALHHQQHHQAAAAVAAAAAAQSAAASAGPSGSHTPQPGGGTPTPGQVGAGQSAAAGLPTSAAAAAFHAAQQAVAMQQQGGSGASIGGVGGVRPQGLPPGLYAMQGLQQGTSLAISSSAAAQHMALPPGVMPTVSHQMSLAAAQGGMANMQQGMTLQSAQLAAAAQLGGSSGMPGGMPGGLPPGMQAASMALPAGMAGATGLTPQQQQQQQQLLAQHLAQQQAAAAAAQQASLQQQQQQQQAQGQQPLSQQQNT